MRERWQPVVYGRTRRVDRWWRVKPTDVPDRWLEDLVAAVVAGGTDLVDGPRFLLAAGRGVRLVGVACRAADLSTTMHSDGNRELYCFVGWTGRASEGEPPPTPSLDAFRACYVPWAGPVYDRWVRPEWDRTASELRTPQAAEPTDLPWREPGSFMDVQGPMTRHEAWPAAEAEALWEWGRTTGQAHAIAIGFKSLSHVPDVLTHVSVDDVSRRTARALPAPPGAEKPGPMADESGLQRDSENDRDRRSSRDLRPGELVSRGVDRVRGYLGTHDKAEEAPRDDGPAPPRRTIDFASGSGSRERLDAAWDFEGAPPEPVAPDPNRDAIPEAGTLTPPGSAPEFVRDRLPLRENLERQGTSFRAVDLSRREGLTVRGAEHGAVCFALRGSARVWIGEREELLDNGGVVSFVGHEHVSIVADEHGTRILIVRKAQ